MAATGLYGEPQLKDFQLPQLTELRDVCLN